MQAICLMLLLFVSFAFGNSDIDSLLEIKKGIHNDPSGLVLNSWDSKSLDSDGCPQNWYGVLCSGGNVVSIVLDNAGLVGEFNFPAIGSLKMLHNLSVLNNKFAGILQIGPTESLEFLDLSLNKFNGLLPSNLAELRNLVYLNLSSNEFEGTLPIGFHRLRQLKYLDLRANNFSGDIMHIFSQMGSVLHVDLSSNRLSGTLDLGLGDDSFLSSIRYLNVSHNSLVGELFAHDGIPYLDSLEVLDASNNQLVGNIPSFMFVVSLRVLRLRCNQLSGSLPQALLKESSMMLSELDLSQNQIKGTFGSITSTTLRKLNMSWNKLSGPLPLRVGHCAVIDLSNNMLSGNLSRIRYWGNYVEVIQLSSNSLTGMLPNETTQFLRLTAIKVSNNSLEGFLPPILATYPELKEIDLSLNQISGFLLPSLFTSTKLTNLNLSNNKFSRSIPIQVQEVPSHPLDSAENFSLVSLDLSHNNLSGVLPSKVSKLCNLAYLNLCNNKLEGTIPNGLPDELREFNVSFNNLSGVVPENLMQFPESAFHPGNTFLIFPKSPPLPKGAPNLALRIHQSHKKSATRIALIASLVTGALVMAFVGILIYYMVHCNKERTSKLNGVRVNSQACSSTSTREASSRNSEALPSLQGGSADDGGKIHGLEKEPKDLDQPEFSKNDDRVPSQMSFLSASNPSSSKSHQFENPDALRVSSPDKLVGDLNIFDMSLALTAEELSCAPAELIGRSCHGTLYKAMLDSCHALAVKWLREGITKGKKEFAREVRKLGTIKHPNLVSIQGYYLGLKEHERLIITNFVNAQSLDIYLHEADKRNLHPLSLDERLRVAVEVARCLHYLHNEKAIPHGNLKSTNILIETPDRNVLLTDYSLHRILNAAGTAEQVLNAGALGYMPPEFTRSSKPCPSLKSDVYAFGVVLLELLTGRNSGEIVSGIPGVVDLTDWARLSAEENCSSRCFDRYLLDKNSSGSWERASRILDEMLKVALRCILHASERPDIKTVFDDLSSVR